jgi:CRISPR-associated protein Cmr3
MTAYRFLQPLDVLFLRGNKLFGDPGSFGACLVPPWPSAVAGALRSLMLAAERIDLAAFAAGEVRHPTLGTPMEPGTFQLTACQVARETPAGVVEILIEPPADLIITHDEDERASVNRLAPALLPDGLAASARLPLLPLLGEPRRRKPAAGYWLRQRALADYLGGRTPAPDELVKTSELWSIDARVGVGLDTARRRAEDGKLFTTQAVAFRPGIGFLVGIDGADPPPEGTLRLGGDGRAAALRSVTHEPPTADLAAIAQAGRCRILLTTPGIFPAGWLPPGVAPDGRFELHGVRGRLVSAAVPRAQIVSGWDLANWQPKPAQRAAPSGSVYWIDALEATPEALGNLAAAGLWSEPCEDPQRRAEGFNRFTFAAWS